jgi:hypothetical protein
VALASDLANHRFAAVHADAHPRPVRMLLGDGRKLLLQCQGGARSPDGMVRLVASAVEDGHHAVADELLQLAGEPAGDQRRGHAPVGVEHCRDLGRRRALREAGEPVEVAEEDADVLAALTRRGQVEVPEALVAPLALGREADDQIGREDQAVPFPPTRVPLALACRGNADQRLGQQ